MCEIAYLIHNDHLSECLTD